MKKLTIFDNYGKTIEYAVLLFIIFAIMLYIAISSPVPKNSQPYFIITEVHKDSPWKYRYKGIDSKDRTWLYIPQEYGTILVYAIDDTVWVER